MTILTSKNLCALFLVGIMLFPIGINQSHAQAIVSMTVVTEEFDFASHVEIGDTCLDAASLTATATGVTGSLGGLSSSVACFSGERTWQAFILNAGSDDDIVQSIDPVVTSVTTDVHEIDFDSLMPATAYRAVLLLSGEYDVDATSYSAASVYRVAEFTTLASTIGTPTAPALTVDISSVEPGTIIIPFSEIIPTVTGNTFEELTVTFSLSTSTQIFSDSFTSFTGTDPTTLAAATSVLEVIGDIVTINSELGSSQEIIFDYTVTNTVGASASGMITIVFVEVVMANPYTVTLTSTDLSSPRPIDLPISASQVRDILLDGSSFGSIGVSAYTFTTNGTGVGSDGNVDDTITGSEGGILTVTNPGASPHPIFHYTPVSGFSGTEAFEYTATTNAVSSSSQLFIVVPAAPGTPTAPNFTVDIFRAEPGTIIIPFSEEVPTVTGNTFEELTVTFSLESSNSFLSNSLTMFTGTNVTSLAAGTSVLEVTGDTVTMSNGIGGNSGDFTFDYTVTNTAGVSASGVITISFLNFIGEVMANPYTVTLADLSELPTVTRTILVTDVASTILDGTKVAGNARFAFTFSDIGTGDAAAGETAIGSDSGTLVVTNPFLDSDLARSDTMLAYTPASGFSGTETFDYTVSLEGKSDSSQFIFIVPAVPGAPIASDHTIEILRGDATARIITLPFSNIISDTTDAFDDLIIIFSTPDDGDNSQFSTYRGTNATDTVATDASVGNDDVLLVISTPVTLANDNAAMRSEDVVIEYTVTDPGGLSDSGTITIKFVNIIGEFKLNTHTITLPDLFGLPTIVTEFDDTIVEDLFLGTTVGRFVMDVYTLTTTGTGNSSGTLVIVPTSVDTPGEFRYTPGDASVGNEGFPYTVTIDGEPVTIDGEPVTSEIIFNVPALVCETDMTPRINFGSLGNGQQSDESLIDIMNDGNAANQVMIHGAQWVDVDGADTMNVGITKWSTASGGYDAKESLLLTDSGIAEVGDALTETNTSTMVYLQLLITLMDETFRGETTQAMTIGSDCST